MLRKQFEKLGLQKIKKKCNQNELGIGDRGDVKCAQRPTGPIVSGKKEFSKTKNRVDQALSSARKSISSSRVVSVCVCVCVPSTLCLHKLLCNFL